jgi:Outer membrane protein beta-barrel domain
MIMKKIPCFFLLFLLLALSATAQKSKRGNDKKLFNLGVKTVLNGSWMGNLPASTTDLKASSENIKLGYVIGFWGRINLIQGLHIQPELTISQTGGKYSYQFSSGVGNALSYAKNITLTNLDIPLSLGYSLPIGDALGLRLNGGGVLSAILSAKQQYEVGSAASLEQDIKSQVNTLQAAIQGGIGLDFLEKWSVDLRLQQNLTSLYEGLEASPTGIVKLDPARIDQQQQRVINIQLIVGFKIF